MNKIVIGGITDSNEFVIGFGLLNLAKKKYPSCFVYDFEDMLEPQYWRWLKRLNKENGWKHKCNFVAWYEYIHGGPKSLIGDLDLFVEYMYEEYNVRVIVSHIKMLKIAEELKEAKMEKMIEQAKNLADAQLRRITVIYENHPGVGLLCREILNHPSITGQHGIELTLYNLLHTTENRTTLHDDLVSLPAESAGFRNVKIAKNLKHALKNCDLLIFMGNDMVWKSDLFEDLKGEAIFWGRMGQLVDKYSRSPDTLRVVFTCMNYPCFNATFFLRHATKLSTDLVVAVTHHVALQPLVYISKASGIPLSNMLQQTAHVWGSPGISQLVDLGNTDVLYNVPKMPVSRYDLENELAAEIDWESGNPFENAEFEDDFTWRKLDYALGERGWPAGLKYPWMYVGQEKARIIKRQQRLPYVTSVRATMDILSAWYDTFVMKTPLSVGVYVSESIYGVPEGIVFSMPALVRNDDRRGWYPYKWCDECRETFNMDHRPRWTREPDPLNDPIAECRTCEVSVCKRHMCSERKVSKRTCRHHRNPDIFLPDDPLLTLTGVVCTVFKLYSDVKDYVGHLYQRYVKEKQAKERKTSKKYRVSFLGEGIPGQDSNDGVSLKNSLVHIEEPSARNDRRQPSFVVRRRRTTRAFHDVQAERIRKELKEEQMKWDAFLDVPIDPKEAMKYMARPVPTELTGIITGAVKMSDLDRQVEKMIKERHKLLAEAAEQEAIPEEEGEEHGTDDQEQGQKEGSDDLPSVQISDIVGSSVIGGGKVGSTGLPHEEEETDSSDEGKDQIGATSSVRKKVTREDKENLEEEIRLQKLLDAVSTDDVPIYKMMRFVFPESPNIPEDPNDPYWYLKNKDYVRHVMKTLGKTGYDDSLGVVYRKEFDANRLAAVEHYWNHVVPRQYGHVYYTPKELRKAEKIQNLKIALNSQLLPDKFADFRDLKIKHFEPPTREMGENDVLYDLRVATSLRKFKDEALKEFMNRPADSVRMDTGVWATIRQEGEPTEAEHENNPNNEVSESEEGRAFGADDDEINDNYEYHDHTHSHELCSN